MHSKVNFILRKPKLYNKYKMRKIYTVKRLSIIAFYFYFNTESIKKIYLRNNILFTF